MQGVAYLAIAFLLGFALPGLLLLFLVARRAQTVGSPRPFVQVVTISVVVAALLSATLRPLAEASLLGAAWLPVLFAPVVEEIGKGIGVLVTPAARASRRDALAFGAIAGLSFAMVENLLYVLSAFLVEGPEVGVLTGAYRAVGPVALHTAASALVGEAIWHARQGPGLGGPGGRALGLFLLAVAAHGVSNAVGGFGLVWPLLVDLALAAFVLLRVRSLGPDPRP